MSKYLATKMIATHELRDRTSSLIILKLILSIRMSQTQINRMGKIYFLTGEKDSGKTLLCKSICGNKSKNRIKGIWFISPGGMKMI